MTKFIKLTVAPQDEIYINPIFITNIRKIKSLNESQPDTAVIHTMDGYKIYPKETVEEIMKKIKQTELIQWDTKSDKQQQQY